MLDNQKRTYLLIILASLSLLQFSFCVPVLGAEEEEKRKTNKSFQATENVDLLGEGIKKISLGSPSNPTLASSSINLSSIPPRSVGHKQESRENQTTPYKPPVKSTISPFIQKRASPTLILVDDDSEDEEGDYQYKPPVSNGKKELPENFQSELNDINENITKNLNVKYSEYSSFFIPFYRGVHYLKDLFPDSMSRKDHRLNTKSGVPLFSSAAYKLLGKKFLDEGIDEELLEQNARLVAKVLGKFKSEYPTEYYQFHQLYSNNHVNFHTNLTSILRSTSLRTRDPSYCFDVYPSQIKSCDLSRGFFALDPEIIG